MEFDKWISKRMPRRREGSVIESALRMAWEAGVQNEREACATMVNHILREGGGTFGDAIRKRSNA
jgi:hypothetical protein